MGGSIGPVIVPALLLAAGFVAVVLVLRPLAGRAPVWPWVEPVPFAVLGAAAILLRARWDEIPERFPVHFAIDGRPNGWAPRTTGGVFGPLVVGLGVVSVLLLARVATAWARGGALGEGGMAPARRFVGGALLGVELFVAGTFATTSLLALGAPLRWVVGTVFGGVVLLLLGIAGSMTALTRLPPDEGQPSHGGWRGGALVYRDARDPDLWIPKRIGVGWTLNFGHPAAWWVLALLLLAPLGIVVAAFFVVAR